MTTINSMYINGEPVDPESITGSSATIRLPRWVECADKASEVLDRAATVEDPAEKDATIREAGAWANLACIYRDGAERHL